jgi:hypothetical protein
MGASASPNNKCPRRTTTWRMNIGSIRIKEGDEGE